MADNIVSVRDSPGVLGNIPGVRSTSPLGFQTDGGNIDMDFWSLNLIHFLDFYFAFTFFAGTLRRLGQYHSVGQLVFAGPGRWPLLLKLVSQYRTIFWTWSMVLPLLLALALWIVQLLASRLLFESAGRPPHGLTVERLVEQW